MSADIQLIYAGGCGGHICNHLILQSGQHTCILDSTDDDHEQLLDVEFETVKDVQWSIEDSDKWKNKEFWPNNELTHQMSTDLGRLYLYCNPSPGLEDVPDYGATRVFLYTDFDTQWQLCDYKKANFFWSPRGTAEQDMYELLNSQWQTAYNNIRLPEWPDAPELQDIESLPENIKNDLQTIHSEYYSRWFEWTTSTSNIEHYAKYLPKAELEGKTVDRWGIYDSAIHCDLLIDLKDVCRTQGQALTDLLDLPYTTEHQALFNRWFDLHPEWLKTLLLEK